MAAITKAVNIGKTIGNLCKIFNSVTISNGLVGAAIRRNTPAFLNHACNIHTTSLNYDLMEFFDDEKNWGQSVVKVGRGWRKDELRLKSNSDLHKLWFILLKEKNMLITMEHECNEKMEVFPNPERIDKVEESMENLEEVVRERNKAYYLLETGETGERPGEYTTNLFGLNCYRKFAEHVVPPNMNLKWFKSRRRGGGRAVRKFLKFYREKLWNEKRKAANRDRGHVTKLLQRFPNVNLDLLKQKYPKVDIDKLVRQDKVRGHFVPKVD